MRSDRSRAANRCIGAVFRRFAPQTSRSSAKRTEYRPGLHSPARLRRWQTGYPGKNCRRCPTFLSLGTGSIRVLGAPCLLCWRHGKSREARPRSTLDALQSLLKPSGMTRGLIRYQRAGHDHFITFSCFERRPLLESATARSLFENALEGARLRYGFCIFGYVIMPEHVHLLVTEPRLRLLSTAVQAMKISVAMRQSERPFWQPRYYDFNVFT